MGGALSESRDLEKKFETYKERVEKLIKIIGKMLEDIEDERLRRGIAIIISLFIIDKAGRSLTEKIGMTEGVKDSLKMFALEKAEKEEMGGWGNIYA